MSVSRSGLAGGRSHALVDLLAVCAAFTPCYLLYTWSISASVLDRVPPGPTPYAGIAVLFGAIVLLVFWQLGLYRSHASVLNLWELETAVKGVGLAAALFFALLFFLKLEEYARLIVVPSIAVATVLIILLRRLLSVVTRHSQLSGRVGRRVLICGCDDTGRLLMKKIVQAPHVGRTVVGFLDDSAPVNSVVECRVQQAGPVVFRTSVLGRLEDLAAVVRLHHVDEVLATLALDAEKIRDILRVAREYDLLVGVVPQLGGMRVDQLQVEDLSAIPVLRPYTAPSRGLYLALKRLFDLAGASLLLMLTAPLWVLAAALIWIDSPGPVFFAHERVGLNGRRFRMLKFRTMRHDTNPYAPSPNGHDEARITRVGRVLRVAGFDEFPQLINVLRGEMTLVGPRPEMPFIVERYTPVQRLRLLAKPGITGVWQLSADRNAEIHENIEYDLYYISRQSLLLDLLILVETVFFTADVVVGHLLREPRQDTRAGGAAPAAVAWERTPALDSVLGMKRETVTQGRPTAPSPRRSTDPSVLVALDQRRSGGVPENWQIYVPVAYAMSRRWPVKMLVAADNVASLDGLLDDPVRRLGTKDYRTDFTPYGSGAGLRALTLGVRAVITDLPHVAAWAKAGGIDVLSIDDHRVRPFTRSPSGKEIAAELARWLPPVVRMQTATVEEG